jgi:2-polyprenyl-3-methyl-5-hydroxy-6-metoxy-1,4-benzoquinol methylase
MNVVESYENYKEEDRLNTLKSKQIEFITNTKALDERLPFNSSILDCGAGTGAYSFYLTSKGHKVTALDITPRHIQYIKKEASKKGIEINSVIGDATDLRAFPDESFDVVLNMGPLYHLPDNTSRIKSMNESYRVLKNGGILVLSYISRFAVFEYVATSDKQYLNLDLSSKLISTGELRSSDKDCFWTDCYFATPSEMVEIVEAKNMQVLDHLASDGVTPLLRERVDGLSEDEFRIWCEHHYSICREPSILGTSNHGLLIAKKI